MSYYTMIMLISILTLATFFTIMLSNKNIEKNVRIGFLWMCSLAIIGSTCDWIGESINGIRFFDKNNYDLILHNGVIFIKVLIIPIIPLVCASKVYESKRNRIMIVLLLVHLIMAIGSMFFNGCIFYIDNMNRYNKSQMYFIYICIFLISTAYMLIRMSRFSCNYQNMNVMQLCSLIFFMIFGMIIDICNPKINISWLCITISIVLSFIYYSGVIQYVDGLTGLLNQKSYTTYFETHSNEEFTLGIFDLNDFKMINDQLGHSFGDDILIIVSGIIRKQYGKYGKCYRIGGDEFAVIIEEKRANIDIEKMNHEFIKKMEIKRKCLPELPHVSYGFASYNPKRKNIQDVFSVKKLADKRMYSHKRTSKSKRR